MTPKDVGPHNESELVRDLYNIRTKIVVRRGTGNSKASTGNIKVGDTVRISKRAGGSDRFEKGYEQGWSKETFTVRHIYPTKPKTYEIEDYAGEIIKGKFYEPELQKVNAEKGVFEIEKILRTRKRKGRKEYLARWVGYSSKFDSWVQDIIHYNMPDGR